MFTIQAGTDLFGVLDMDLEVFTIHSGPEVDLGGILVSPTPIGTADIMVDSTALHIMAMAIIIIDVHSSETDIMHTIEDTEEDMLIITDPEMHMQDQKTVPIPQDQETALIIITAEALTTQPEDVLLPIITINVQDLRHTPIEQGRPTIEIIHDPGQIPLTEVDLITMVPDTEAIQAAEITLALQEVVVSDREEVDPHQEVVAEEDKNIS